ncbi:MAG: alpha/beta hydrolase, partial [Pseudomonadota bacterium]
SPLALILHPHPEHEGTMNNKVVYLMYRTLAHHGFAVMRFNFRGAGRSQGSFSKGEGELADAAVVLDWLQKHNEGAQQNWICGYSFGAWIGMQLMMRRPEISRFIAVSPPANMYDFSFLAPCPASGLIIQGTQDTIVPPSAQKEIVTRLQKQPKISIDYEEIEGADHFFVQHLDHLQKVAYDYIAQHKDAVIAVMSPTFRDDENDGEDDYDNEGEEDER